MGQWLGHCGLEDGCRYHPLAGGEDLLESIQKPAGDTNVCVCGWWDTPAMLRGCSAHTATPLVAALVRGAFSDF